MNQRVWRLYVRLRTILSTKNVKKRAALDRPMLSARAAKIFIGKISLIKINGLPYGKAISHKFIHRNCGQVPPCMHGFVALWK
jgi:hypothetical protein